MIRLPDLVGSPLSLNALREDLQVNHRTIARWACILERIYSIFRLPPLGAPHFRDVQGREVDFVIVEDGRPSGRRIFGPATGSGHARQRSSYAAWRSPRRR
jgi:hypothetical protein